MKHFLIIALMLMALNITAQEYEHAYGGRIGYTSGIVYKRFFTEIKAVEALLSFQRSGAQLYLIRQYYHPIFLKMTSQVFIYYGFGFHFGYSYWSNKKYYFGGVAFRKRESSLCAGLNGNVGIEYRFVKFPMVMTFDYKPYAEINVPQYFRNNNFDFAVTLTIVR